MDRPLGATNDQVVYPAEADFNFFLAIAERELNAGKSIEEAMVAIRASVRETFSDERFRNSISWIFRRKYEQLEFILMKDEIAVTHILDRYMHSWDGEKALAKMKIISPKTQVTKENTLAVVMFFGAFQYMVLFPEYGKHIKRWQYLTHVLVLVIALAVLGAGIGLAGFLAFAGHVASITALIGLAGIMGIVHAVRGFLNFHNKTRKFTR